MNNGRIWCVVSPTVGLPLFLGSVTLIALSVHYHVLNHTTWFSNYWNGAARPKVGMMNSTSPVAALTENGSPEFAINVAPVADGTGNGGTGFVVTVTPKPAIATAASAGRPELGVALAATATR